MGGFDALPCYDVAERRTEPVRCCSGVGFEFRSADDVKQMDCWWEIGKVCVVYDRSKLATRQARKICVLSYDVQVSEVGKVNDDVLSQSASYLENNHYQHTVPTCQKGQNKATRTLKLFLLLLRSALPPRPTARKHMSEPADTTVDMVPMVSEILAYKASAWARAICLCSYCQVQ